MRIFGTTRKQLRDQLAVERRRAESFERFEVRTLEARRALARAEAKQREAEKHAADAWAVGHRYVGEIEQQRKDQVSRLERELLGIRSALLGQLQAAEAELAVLRQQVAASQKREAAIADFIESLTASLARRVGKKR